MLLYSRSICSLHKIVPAPYKWELCLWRGYYHELSLQAVSRSSATWYLLWGLPGLCSGKGFLLLLGFSFSFHFFSLAQRVSHFWAALGQIPQASTCCHWEGQPHSSPSCPSSPMAPDQRERTTSHPSSPRHFALPALSSLATRNVRSLHEL